MNENIYDPPKSDIDYPTKNTFLSKAWKGRVKLWKAFWLVHILGIVLSLMLGLLSQLIIVSIADTRLPNFVTLIPMAIIFPLTLVCLWRSAPDPKGPIKDALARLWVVLASVYYFSMLFRVLSGPQ